MRGRRSTAILAVVAALSVGTTGMTAVRAGPTCDITGTEGGDHLVGTPGPDVICGLGGADIVEGLGGDDILIGGDGSDQIDGGTEDDVLIGGEGADQLVGGPGLDQASYADGGKVHVDLGEGEASGQGQDQLGGIENVEGTSGDDVLIGDGQANRLEGRGAIDLLLGGGGVDDLLGGNGPDYLNGGPDGAELLGGDGADACLRGSPSSCYTPGISDPNDTHGLMDVKKVRSHAGATPPRWKVVTFAPWTHRKVWDRGYVLLSVDTVGGSKPDYHVLAYSNGNQMRGGLYRVTNDGGEVRMGPAPVSKAGGKGAVVELPLGKLDRTRPYFRWSIMTLFTGSGCGKVCFERVPGKVQLPQAVLAEL